MIFENLYYEIKTKHESETAQKYHIEQNVEIY